MTEKKFIIDIPELMAEWDWEKNNELGLNPKNLTHGSNKKAYWTCANGHSYNTVIANRIYRNGKCPICSNKIVVTGINDLATTHPTIANEWDYEQNDSLKPQDIVAGSSKRVWWKCKDCGFSWKTSSVQRTRDNDGCPYCSGHVAMKGINDLQTTNPELANEWNYDKNGSLMPCDVLPQSNKIVWWKCKEGHEWTTSICIRYRGCGCPVCCGKTILQGYNDLRTLRPDIAEEWHPTKNAPLCPTQVGRASQRKVWWICKEGHEWQASIANRTNVGSGCPICKNKKVLSSYNDLATTHPEIAKEWHPTKNKSLLPSDVIAGSNKKVWWMCRKGHEWFVAPNQRTQGRGCPVCSEELHTSFPEQCLFFYLRQCIIAENRYMALGKEIDIYIPSLHIGIEHNGLLYHRGKESADKEKKEYFLNQGIRILTVRESDSNQVVDDAILYNCNDRNRENLTWAIKTVFEILKLACPPIDIQADSLKIHNQYIAYEKQNSIETTHPDIAREWHPTKNGRLEPSMVSSGSNLKVWWKCKQGHEWQTDIAHRTAGRECPYCCNKKVLEGYNDLCTTHPHLVEEWNYERNGNLLPKTISAGSNKKVWWKCKEGHEWQAIVYNRKKGKDCPFCYKYKGCTKKKMKEMP